MRTPRGFELTYCSNIHPAHGWQQVFESLRKITPELKRRLSSESRFGIGLRLSNEESVQLLEGNTLEEFASFLRDEGLYVSLINGFPFAGFHDCSLKDQVFAPDWHSVERVDYTLRLAEILARLLPPDLDGGVSTCPLSYKRWAKEPNWDQLVAHTLQVAATLADIKQRTGKLIHLDIEPEPDGLVENTPEFLKFFERLLLGGVSPLSEQVVRDHVTICYDVCHFAVEHETPSGTVAALQSAGVKMGRAQISSAVKVDIPRPASDRQTLRKHLEPLADSTYLHQVIGDRERFQDLPDGLAELGNATSEEWRIHYHVPLFLENYGLLSSTQAEVREALNILTPEITRNLEIETYTWSVLPADMKLDITDSIEREYRWVTAQL